MKTLIDANVILRYLLDDIEEQADIAERIIDNGAYTLPEIIAEVVYVLKNVYKMPRDKIRDCGFTILTQVDIQNRDVMFRTMQLYAETSFDFVDCELMARKEILQENIFTFDEKLYKRIAI